jgi:O-acetyl-ADP-ribose deacetylase
MLLPQELRPTLSLRIGDRGEIRLLCGDITRYPADAIVNAANSELEPGGGVCGAIHRKGGPVIAEECRKILRERGTVPPGGAVATIAGNLEAKYVIHAIGPVWRGGHAGEADALASCYRVSVRLADDFNLHSIAFPAISTGIYGYPLEQAAQVAIPALIEALREAKHVTLVSLVLFDEPAFDVFALTARADKNAKTGEPCEIAD